jgi:HlyD family secretion protein
MRRIFIIVIVVAVLGVGGFFAFQAYQNGQAASQASYQTSTITRGDLTAIVGATGTVRANQSAMLGWQTTGQIAKINVKVGDKVTTNQVLASLDVSSLPQTIILAQADLVTAKRSLDNLKNSTVNQGAAQLALAQAQQAVTDAQHDRDLLNYDRAGNGNADAAWAAYYIAVDNYNKALDRFNSVANRDPSDPLRANYQAALVSAQQAMQQKQNIVNWYTSGPSANDIAQSDAKLALAKDKLADAQREWDRLKNGPDPQDIAAAEARVAAIQATLAMPNIDAPFNGVITDIRSMIGDQVGPTTLTFRLDDLARLLVDVQITEVDINRVKVGQPVTLSFDAISGKEYHGKIFSVAKVGVSTNGTVNFTVTIELTDTDDAVRPGMTSAVNIVVDQLSDVLLVENRAVRLSKGQRIVYLLRGGNLTSTPITLGAISDTSSEILSGDVQDGDVLVLNPPVTFTAPSGGQPSFLGGR